MRQFISLALVATAAAQMDIKALIGGMSPQCQAAAGGLMTSDFSGCSNLMGLVNILGASGSLLPPMNAWVTSICGMPPCSASATSTAMTTIQGGCQADAKKGVPAALELTMLVSNYATIRNALCLQYTSNHTGCASDLLANTEKIAGRPLTLLEVSGFLVGGVSSLAPTLAKAPKESFCNDCTHALTTVLSPASASMSSSMPSMPMSGNSSMTAGPAAMCGPSFADGKIPDGIAVNDGTTPPSGSATPASGGKSPANGGAPSSSNSVSIPVFASLAILGTATVFTTMF